MLDRDIGLLFTTPARMPTYLSIQIFDKRSQGVKTRGVHLNFFSMSQCNYEYEAMEFAMIEFVGIVTG